VLSRRVCLCVRAHTQVRSGQEVENAEIVRFARLFNDELTLDNLERLQVGGRGG